MDDSGMNVYVVAADSSGGRGAWVRLPMDDEGLGRAAANLGSAPEALVARDYDGDGLFDALGLELRGGERVAALNDLAWLAQDLDDFRLEAVRTLVGELASPMLPDYANAVVQADEIPFFDYGSAYDPASSPAENYAMMWVDLVVPELSDMLAKTGVDCFVDWEALGRDKAMDCVLSDTGYLDLSGAVPDLGLYGPDELADLARDERARETGRDEER